MAKCKAAVVVAAGQIEVQEFPLPDIHEDDGLLKVEMCGVCGSDPKYFYQKVSHKGRAPLIMGHEMIGIVEKAGPKALARWGVKEGDRVIVESNFGCGECSYCLRGITRYCGVAMGYGSRVSCDVPPYLWGGYAEYMYLHPRTVVHKVAPGANIEVASLICAVLANGLRWVDVSNMRPQDTVVVQGVGAAGLATIAAARSQGAGTIIATGLSRDIKRLEVAKNVGADYAIDTQSCDAVAEIKRIVGGEGVDVIFDVTGAPAAMETSMRLIKPFTRIILVGLSGGKVSQIELDQLVWKEVDVHAVQSYDTDSVIRALEWIKRPGLGLEQIVSHRFPLSEAAKAIKMTTGEIENPDFVKGVIVPSM